MAIVFASDLHLCAEQPDKVALFEALLERASTNADTVYILGDLFEIWLGDDDDSAPHPTVMSAMRAFTASGAQLFIMSGNRDFLLGSDFAKNAGASLLPDWHTVDLFGTRTLLTHGDLLCTKDVQYQAFRKYVRDPANQQAFLAQDLEDRRKIAAETRSGTQASMLEKDDFIMDVEQTTVERVMDEFSVARLIHGHTHRPAVHTFETGGKTRERLVLGDWYEEDCSVVVCDKAGVSHMPAKAFANAEESAFG